MKRGSVAYLGPPASYTHQAARLAFPDKSYLLTPYPSIAEVFAAVQDGAVLSGVVPFENSTYGPVLTTFDLFATALAHFSETGTINDAPRKAYLDVRACRDVFVAVRHCLLGRRPGSADSYSCIDNKTAPMAHTISDGAFPSGGGPPASLSHITRVQSHEQALGQCKNFLATHLKHAEKKVVSSTSKAAELAAADPTGQIAAISSELAAEVYGLDILQHSIQDREDNATRFLVLERRTGEPKETLPSSSEATGEYDLPTIDGNNATSGYKALLIFTVAHTSAGALADSLAVFKDHDVNLTSINTRPSGLAPWHYYFFVEVFGRGEANASEGTSGSASGKGKIDAALGDLAQVAKSWRCLGSWSCE